MGLKTLRWVFVKPILLDLTELILPWKQPHSSAPQQERTVHSKVEFGPCIRRDSKTESFPPFLFFFTHVVMVVVGHNALPCCCIPMFILTQSCIFRQTFLRAKRAQD